MQDTLGGMIVKESVWYVIVLRPGSLGSGFFHIPSDLVMECFSRSLKASRGEDLEIEELVSGRYASAFYFHATLTCMLSAALIGDEVVQVRQPRQERLLTATGMV